MKSKTIIAFHGDPKVKEKYTARLKAHAAADEIIQGIGWEFGKGCAVGCTLENYNHDAYPVELGIPKQLAELEDAIFEGLHNAEAKEFAVDFLEAIPVSADLTLVWPRFAVWLLTDPVYGTIQYCDDAGRDATKKIAELFNQTIAGTAARDAAASHARDAAYQAQRDFLLTLLRTAPVTTNRAEPQTVAI